MKHWSDPRIPDREISRLELVLASVIVIVPPAIFLWGLVAPIIRPLSSNPDPGHFRGTESHRLDHNMGSRAQQSDGTRRHD
jgi:hypothetical protein